MSHDLAHHFRVDDGDKFRLKDHDPGATLHFKSKEHAHEELAEDVAKLSALQEKLYADGRWALLAIFQAMDAAGKDSAIKHVMSGVNPQGCEVFSFKAPSDEELRHDFLWRTACRLPERGRIGIFNRSYYEEVLVVRVHEEKLERERLPKSLVSKDLWNERFESINSFERHLVRNGTVLCKFFLNVSRGEQKKRFLARLDDAEKTWKLSPTDVSERARWKTYMDVYEDMICHTANRHAPWFVIPADNKWFSRLIVARVLIEALEELDLKFPKPDPAKRKELESASAALENEKS